MQSCNENLSAFLSANETIWLPSAIPAALDGLGIITSIAKPSGCHLSASGRTPPMLWISGNTALMVRAARIVLTCSPRSGATSAIRTCGAFLEATCHRDARDAGAVSAGAPVAGTADAAHADVVGAAAVICRWQHGASATTSALPWWSSAWALP